MYQFTDVIIFTTRPRAVLHVVRQARKVGSKSLAFRPMTVLSLMLVLIVSMASTAQAAAFTVNETDDTSDANLGDNVCDSNLSVPDLQCTLRAAIEQANALPGADTISLAVPGPYNLTNGQLVVSSQITLSGNGGTIRRTGASQFGIFRVTGTGDLTLNNVTVRDGDIAGPGGGIRIESGGIANIHSSTISHNAATGPGGGLFNEGTLNILNSAILNNTATGWGGGITNSGVLNIANSTIAGNIASHDGGGLDNTGAGNGGTANLTNVTITNNVANNDGLLPGTGGGIFRYSGTVNLKNSLIAGNVDTPGNPSSGWNKPDIGGTIISHNYNLIGNVGTTSFTSQPQDQVGTGADPIDPLLGNLRGQPAYHPLQVGSPAIDQIPAATHCVFISSGHNPLFNDNAAIDTDQRGAIRPADGDNNGTFTCDIGPYEFMPPIYLPIILNS